MANRSIRGFTLIEMMAVAAVLSILAVVAIPAYNNYTAKAKFSEVVVSTGATKAQIEICVQTGGCVGSNRIVLGGSGDSSSSTLSVGETFAAFEAYDQVAQAEDPGPWTETPDQWANNMLNDIHNGFPIVMAECSTVPYIVVGVDIGDSGGNPCDDALSGAGGDTNPGGAIQQLVALGDLVPVSAFQSAYNALTGQTGSGFNLPCIGPAPCTPPTKYVISESADATGTITATAQSAFGLSGETYVLVPQLLGNATTGWKVDWQASGTCKTRAGGALC